MTPSLTQTADVAIPELKGLQDRLLLVGAVGAVLSLAGGFFNTTQFLQSYLMAYMLWLGVTLGCLGGYGLQYWSSVMAYPLNIGGKPLHSWPAFIPVTFECTILVAALSAVLGMLALNGLPQPYHSVFNVPRFALASRNRFFLCIEAREPRFDIDATRRFLETLNPREVTTVAD